MMPNAHAASTIPFTEAFDAYSQGDALPSTNGWSASTNTVIAQTTNTYNTSAAAAYIPASQIATNTFTKNTSQTNVWIDMRVKVNTSATPPEFPSTISCAFYFHTNGAPVVQSGVAVTNWSTNSLNMKGLSVPKSNVTAGNWVRITVYKDYLRKKWALFVDNTLVRDDFDFYNTSVDGLSGFSVKNHTFIDEIAITTNRPSAASGSHTNILSDIDGDGAGDAWEIDYFGNIDLYDGSSDPDSDGRNNTEEYNGGTDPTVANHDPQGIPYREDFDNTSAGSVTSSWHGMVISGIGEVITSDYIDASQSLSLSDGAMDLLISDATATNIWCQFYTKISLYDDGSSEPAVTTNDQAVFYVNTNRDLMAYSGAAWLKVRTNSMPTNVWVGFAAHLDYENEEWDLFISTNGGYNVAMERVNGDPMAFAGINTETTGALTNLSISVGSSMLIDAISVSTAYELPSTTHTNVQGFDRLTSPGSTTERPPYNYIGTNETLLVGADLGEDIKRGITTGNTVQIYYTNGWNMYYLDSSLNWQKQYGMDIEDLQVGPSAPMKFISSEDMTVFYTFGATVTNAPTEVILGSDSYNSGWNLMEVNFSTERTMNHPTLGLNLTGAEGGDRIYMDGIRYIYNSTIGKWKDRSGNVNTNLTFGPGSEGFWYYRRSASDMNWTVP